jgi:hypothetical protein
MKKCIATASDTRSKTWSSLEKLAIFSIKGDSIDE